MSQTTAYEHSRVNWVLASIISIIIIVIPLMFFSIDVSLEKDAVSLSSENKNECQDFIRYFEDVSLATCIEYLNKNPDAVGQDLINHHEIIKNEKIETLLTEPFMYSDACTGRYGFCHNNNINLSRNEIRDECGDLTKHFDHISITDCTSYLRENTHSNGQQIVDHFTTLNVKKTNMLLSNQILHDTVDDCIQKFRLGSC